MLAHLGRQFASSPGSYEVSKTRRYCFIVCQLFREQPSYCETEADQGYSLLHLNNSRIDTTHSTYPPPPGLHNPTAYPVQSNHESSFNSGPTYAQVASTPLNVNATSPVRLLNNHNLTPPHQLYGPSLLAPSAGFYNRAPHLNHGRQVPGPQQHPPWPQQVQPIFCETTGLETHVTHNRALLPSSQHPFSPTDRNLVPTNPTYADVARMPTFVPCPAQEVPTHMYHSRYLSHLATNGASSINTGHGQYLAPRSQPSGRKREYQSMCDEHQGLLAMPACNTQQDPTLAPFVTQPTIHNNPRSVKDLVHEVSRGGHRGPPLQTTNATGDGSGSNSTPISPTAVSTLSSSAQKRPRRTGAALSEVDDINTERCGTCGKCYPAKEMRSV